MNNIYYDNIPEASDTVEISTIELNDKSYLTLTGKFGINTDNYLTSSNYGILINTDYIFGTNNAIYINNIDVNKYNIYGNITINNTNTN